MPTDIRFTIHTRQTPENELYDSILSRLVYYENRTDLLSRIIRAINIVQPLVENSFTFQFPEENIPYLQRHDSVELNVQSQSYDSTDKHFDSCSICTDKYNNSDIVVSLSCHHIFHSECIKEWGKYNPVCPICKKDIMTYSK